MMPELNITPLDNPRSYRLAGELDMSNASQLAEVLREECSKPGDVALDLSALTFMDSSGLHVVLDASRQLESNGHLILRNPTKAVGRIFEVSGIEQVETIRVEKTSS